ncbi:hypothetical protein Bca52824_001724 [Brassica carinata]|uniref:Uncharacterized protein n=1 Tax=Brassica carinata TaxID=52824 RepID=A0A8X7WIV8_BRACI|nr:hypothetical protein Bca52824_001724 [Brassica carinata]
MGQYIYSQPSSSSNSQDLTSLIEAEAEMYAAEAEISQWNAEAIHYEPSPEGDDGIPRTCYCGSEPVHRYSQTPKDPYRRKTWKGFQGVWRTIFVSLTRFTHVGRSHGCIWSLADVGRVKDSRSHG